MSAAEWGMLALICATGAISPGPSLVFVLAQRTRFGAPVALRAALGHGVGVGVCAAAAVFGIASLVLALPTLTRTVEALGGLFLLWLAWGQWPRAQQKSESMPPEPVRPRVQAWLSGLLVAVLNPKVLVVFIGIFAAFAPATATTTERLGMAVLAAGIDAGWYALMAVAGGTLARSLAQTAVQRGLALLLALFGLAVLGRVAGLLG